MSEDPTLLVTRPEAAGQRFLNLVEARLGPVRAVLAPLLEIVPVPAELPAAEALILTSAHAIGAVPEGWRGPVYTVGPRTTEAARAAGLNAQMAGRDADGLVDHLGATRPEGRLLHLRGAHTRGDVAARLAAAGLTVAERVVYDQPSRALSPEGEALLAGKAPVIAPVFSPRTAGLFRPYAEAARAPLAVLALSPAVAEALGPALQPKVVTAATPDAAAMLALVERRYGPSGSP